MARQTAASQLGTPPGTYLFSLAQTQSGWAVIGSDDRLRFFAGTSLDLHHATACNTGVSSLTSTPDRQGLYTAGRDGLIHGWDARTRTKTVHIKEPKAAGFSALACQDNCLAAGTESTKEGLGDVNVHIFDIRKPNSALRTYSESHTDSITDLAWHPLQRNLLLSGSTDGLVSIFDVEHADEEDAIQQVLNPRSAVHCAGFVANDQAYVLSTDEHFTIYGLNKTGTADEEALPVAEVGDLRPKLDCMYAINLLTSTPLSSPVLAYGHNEKKKVAITVLDQSDYAFGRSVDLPGAHGDEVVRDLRFADSRTVLTCGEDGFVRCWDLGHVSNQNTTMEIDSESESTTKKNKKHRKDKKHADRFQPY